jgi:hypothetical protein
VKYGVEHALDYLDTCLHFSHFPDHPPATHDIDLFHTVAQVKIGEHIDFSFHNNTADLKLNSDLERMNFTEIKVGTPFGIVKPNTPMPLISKDDNGMDNTNNFFAVNNQHLVIRKAVMPSMLTLNEAVIRQDCLCYLMERMELPANN